MNKEEMKINKKKKMDLTLKILIQGEEDDLNEEMTLTSRNNKRIGWREPSHQEDEMMRKESKRSRGISRSRRRKSTPKARPNATSAKAMSM